MAPEDSIEWEDGSASCEAQFVRLAHPLVRLDVGPWLPIHAGLLYLYVSGKSEGPYSFLHALAVFFAILGHILTALAQHWSVHAWRRIAFRKVYSPVDATHVYARTVSQDARTIGSAKLPAAIVPLEALAVDMQPPRPSLQGPAQDLATAIQSLPAYRFLWRSVSYELRPSPSRPSAWRARSAKVDLPIALPLDTYTLWAGGSTGWTAAQAERLLTKFGENVVPVPLPSFLTLMMEHATAPFFVFQISCVGLWCLDEYVWYSLFTLFTLVAMEATLVFQRRTTAKQLRGMRPAPHPVWAYRAGAWRVVPSQALVPLDIISLSREGAQAAAGGGSAKEKGAADAGSTSSVPCPADVLLLTGQAVVNEAMLTGESTPMVKEGVGGQAGEGGKQTTLDALTEGSDRSHTRHVVYSGTAVITAHGEAGQSAGPRKEAPPDGGALAVVLRTGAHTSQGELLGVILHSAERVSVADSEAFAFIGGMLVFALAAAWYVLTKGLQDPTRDRWKLGLHVIMIITTVVPPELPVELSMAVNMSLTGLLRKGIYCTEPARIPLAGQVGTVCMDKTGTLTSDTFRVQGVTLLPPTAGGRPIVIPTATALPAMSQLVLLGCHDLLAVQVRVPPPPKRPGVQAQAQAESTGSMRTEYAGDPIEQAAHSALGWAVDGSGTARPLGGPRVGTLESWGVLPDTAASASPAVRVLHRWPFTSALKRMTCAVQVNAQGLEAIRRAAKGSAKAGTGATKAALDNVPTGQGVLVTKGAPEVVEKLLAAVPPGYAATQAQMSAKGSRVLALAYRVLPPGTTVASLAGMGRRQAEQGLSFAGFLACSSPLKTDSARVVKELQEAELRCCMITGDSPLTALAVAGQLGMRQQIQPTVLSTAVTSSPSAAVLDLGDHGEITLTHPTSLAHGDDQARAAGDDDVDSDESAEERDEAPDMTGVVPEMIPAREKPGLSAPVGRIATLQDVLRAATGLSLLAITGRALEVVQRTWHPDEAAHLCSIVNVYARVSPSQKEWVVGALQGSGHSCAMLGDGSNDTGALKKASLGLAVLSNPELEARWDRARVEQAARRREARINVQAMAHAAPSARIMAAKQAAMANAGEEEDEGELEALLKSEQERTASLVQQYAEHGEDDGEGAGGLAESITSSLLKSVEAKAAAGSTSQQAELTALKDRLKKLEQEAALEGGMGSGPPVVSLGDASMAAPLTSKLPTPAAILEVLRQGRCTLVTTHQMFKILGVNALVQAYMMSVLHLANVRLGDYQATTVAMGAASCFMLISMAKPIRKLSMEKPRKSVFHPGLILSVLGQFAVHTCSLLLASALVGHNPWDVQPPTLEEMANYTAPVANLTVQAPVAEELIGADLLSSKLAADAVSLGAGGVPADGSGGGGVWSLLFGDSAPESDASTPSTFKPSHVNTAVFLVYASAQACTFLASYHGPPFMAALKEQTSLVRACGAMYLACVLGALGLVPELNSWLQLLPLDDMSDRVKLAVLIVLDGVACMGAEYLARAVDRWWYVRKDVGM